ncbi:hypothetical protein BU17DRAFT_70709 [Hysterangium stoloniferum]|nr:hypothetical protein BU17DRAFT_70709 [Hysterangium stoloniferum]
MGYSCMRGKAKLNSIAVHRLPAMLAIAITAEMYCATRSPLTITVLITWITKLTATLTGSLWRKIRQVESMGAKSIFVVSGRSKPAGWSCTSPQQDDSFRLQCSPTYSCHQRRRVSPPSRFFSLSPRFPLVFAFSLAVTFWLSHYVGFPVRNRRYTSAIHTLRLNQGVCLYEDREQIDLEHDCFPLTGLFSVEIDHTPFLHPQHLVKLSSNTQQVPISGSVAAPSALSRNVGTTPTSSLSTASVPASTRQNSSAVHAGQHLSVTLDAARPTTTTTIDELMGKCELRTKLPLQGIIGHHVPAVTVQGMVAQLSSAKFNVVELKRTDNGLANGMRRPYVSFAKPTSQNGAISDETPLGPRMQINDNLFNEPQSKSATLRTSSRLPESRYPERSISMIEEVDTPQMYAFDVAHWGSYGSKDLLPFAATKYNQTPEVACCLPAVDRCVHLEVLSHNACGRPPDAVHMSWFCPSHRDRYLKSQQAVPNNPQWPSLGAHLETAGNRGIIGIVIPDDPEEEGPAEALENARSPSKPVSWFCCKNVITATGDLKFRSSHKDSDLNANRIIGNKTWLVSPVDVRSGQIGRCFLRFLDKSALVGTPWKLTLWKLAAQAMLPRGTAQHEGVQASMTWREETGSFQLMRLHPTQVTYAMKHNYDKYPPSKNQFKDARARRRMRPKRMRQAADGYGGCILGDGFSRTSFGDDAAVAGL